MTDNPDIFASRHDIVTKLVLQLLSHRSSKVRIQALEFVVSTYKVPHHIDQDVLKHVLRSMDGFHSETEPQARTDFVDAIKILFSRIESSVHRLDKEAADMEKLQTDTGQNSSAYLTCETKREYLNVFVRGYSRLLQAGLQLSASYQQHISCLKIMEYLVSATGDIKWVSAATGEYP